MALLIPVDLWLSPFKYIRVYLAYLLRLASPAAVPSPLSTNATEAAKSAITGTNPPVVCPQPSAPENISPLNTFHESTAKASTSSGVIVTGAIPSSLLTSLISFIKS